jgi:hypothetical protein
MPEQHGESFSCAVFLCLILLEREIVNEIRVVPADALHSLEHILAANNRGEDFPRNSRSEHKKKTCYYAGLYLTQIILSLKGNRLRRQRR